MGYLFGLKSIKMSGMGEKDFLPAKIRNSKSTVKLGFKWKYYSSGPKIQPS